VKPPAAVSYLEAYDRTAEQLQRRLSKELRGQQDVATQAAEEFRGNGCLSKYRSTIATAVSTFQDLPRPGTRLIACYLSNAMEADLTMPIAIYRIGVNFKGRRGIDACTIKEAIYKPGLAKGDHESERVCLSRKGARFVRRFGFDGLRLWIMQKRGWIMEEDPNGRQEFKNPF
jgi:hypothetical protein